MHASRLARTLFFMLIVTAAVASCSLSGTSTGPGAAPPAGAASFPLGRVPGNSATAPLPTDAPAAVIALAPLPSCGAEILFEQDVDISPIPTAPGPVTDPATSQKAVDCLIAAWENGLKAELAVSAISDEADEIYTIYRLNGDGTLQLIVRVRSHSDKTIGWTQTTCRQLSVQQGTLTPADCDLEKPIT
jgi:hypothetical protein